MSDNNTEAPQSLFRKKVEIGERGKQAISAVSMAVGGESPLDDTGNSPSSGSGRRPRGGRNRRRDRRPRQGKETRNARPRSENRSGQDTERKPVLKPVNSRNSLEERLAYYREKYGEDFKPAENAE